MDSGILLPIKARTRRQKDHDDVGPMYPETFALAGSFDLARVHSQKRPSGVCAKEGSLSTRGFLENRDLRSSSISGSLPERSRC